MESIRDLLLKIVTCPKYLDDSAQFKYCLIWMKPLWRSFMCKGNELNQTYEDLKNFGIFIFLFLVKSHETTDTYL